MHVRAELRAAIVTALTGLPLTGPRVFTGRVQPVPDMPAIVVNTVDETAEPRTLYSPTLVERVVEIEVTCMAKAAIGIANTLDEIALNVEAALGSNIVVSGVNVPIAYTRAEIEYSGEADQPIGRAILTFSATLYSLAASPGTLANG
jgi:hypothetical protein